MPRYGIFSDVHANVAALEAVLAVMDEAGCDQLLCCGDIVGYGPSPSECLRLIRERNIPCVLGNHDQYVTLLMDERISRLREDVRSSVEWTQNTLDMDDLKWLAQLPMRYDTDDLSIVHGAFGSKHWTYLTNEKSVRYNFRHQDVALAFCGHSHVPLCAYALPAPPAPPAPDPADTANGAAPKPSAPAPMMNYLKSTTPVPEAEKVVFNVGSVGQPRDHDPRAMCIIYDTADACVRPRRVPYDISATQDLMRAAGLHPRSIMRLELGR